VCGAKEEPITPHANVTPPARIALGAAARRRLRDRPAAGERQAIKNPGIGAGVKGTQRA
jgi:hypothetical protein